MKDAVADNIQGQREHGREDSFVVVFTKVITDNVVFSISRLVEVFQALSSDKLQ